MALSEVGNFGRYTRFYVEHVQSDPNPHLILPYAVQHPCSSILWVCIGIKVNSGIQQEIFHIKLDNK